MLRNLKNALPLLASALANKQGVKVLQGEWAKTNCVDTIWLPPLPDDDPAVIAKALGFVGHETAHISFTDTSVNEDVARQKKPETFFGVMNLLEDIRIEILQKRRYPGVSDNLDALTKILVDEQIFSVPAADSHPAKIVFSWLLFKLRYEVLSQPAFEQILLDTQVLFEKVLSKNAQIRLEAIAFEVADAKSTRDIFNLTTEIISMLEEEAEAERQNEIAKQQQQQQQNQAANGSGTVTDSSTGDSSEGGDSEGDDSDSGDSGNGKSGDTESSTSQDDSTGSESGNDVQSGASGAGEDQGSGIEQSMADVIEQILSAGKAEQYQDIGEVLSTEINTIKTKAIKSQKNDGSGPMRVFNAAKQPSKGRNATYDFTARATVNALKLKLHNLLQSQTMTSTHRSDQGTRFSKRHLHEIKIGGKVFEKRSEGIDIDVTVGVLIDISGSMQGDELKTAALAGYATAEALSSVHGVSTAVAVFPTANGVDYLSTFGSKPVVNAENFAQLSATGSTPLSDSMSRVGIDLLSQPQQRKILLVITDGEPNSGDQSAQVINAAQSAGIEIMGVGIGVELDHLFNTWCSINSIDDLPKVMFSMLQRNLSIKMAA